MKIAAQVLDQQTGKPIANASIIVTGISGSTLDSGTMADSNGNFSLDSDALDQDDVWVTISCVGYTTGDFPPARFDGTNIKVQLDQDAGKMEGVVVTAKRKVQAVAKKSYALPLALGSAALITTAIYFYIRK
jgi:5-hydroxyisourate hydrolase-like protein (transthyretin family)